MINNMNPCERTDDIKEIKRDVKELKTSFDNFRLNISIDVTELKTKLRLSGAIVAIIVSAIISIGGRFI
jgi:hypothetical protein